MTASPDYSPAPSQVRSPGHLASPLLKLTPQPPAKPTRNPQIDAIAHCSFVSPVWPQFGRTQAAVSQAQGIEAEIPQADRREAEELERKARPRYAGLRPKTKTA
jgi:hypothetical protein